MSTKKNDGPTYKEGSLHEAAMFCDVAPEVIAALPAAWPDPVNRAVLSRLLIAAKAQERGTALIALVDNILAYAPAQEAAPAAPVAQTQAAPVTVVLKEDKTKEPADMSLSEAVHARADGDMRQEVLDRIGTAAAELQAARKLPTAFIVLAGGKLDAVTIDKIVRHHAKGNQPPRELWTNSAREDVRALTFRQYAREEFPASPYGEQLIDGMDSKGRRWEKETPERGRLGLRFVVLARQEEVPTPDDAFEALSGMQDVLRGRYLRFAEQYEAALKDDQHTLHPVAQLTDLVYRPTPAVPVQAAAAPKPQYRFVLVDERDTNAVVSEQPGDDDVVRGFIATINFLQRQAAITGFNTRPEVVIQIEDNLKAINARRRSICGVPAAPQQVAPAISYSQVIGDQARVGYAHAGDLHGDITLTQQSGGVNLGHGNTIGAMGNIDAGGMSQDLARMKAKIMRADAVGYARAVKAFEKTHLKNHPDWDKALSLLNAAMPLVGVLPDQALTLRANACLLLDAAIDQLNLSTEHFSSVVIGRAI